MSIKHIKFDNEQAWPTFSLSARLGKIYWIVMKNIGLYKQGKINQQENLLAIPS